MSIDVYVDRKSRDIIDRHGVVPAQHDSRSIGR
jgi:hypothetical protein